MAIFSNIGLIINYNKRQPVQLGLEIARWLKDKNIQVFAPKEDSVI